MLASSSARSYGRLRLRLDQELPILPGQFAMLKPHGSYEPLLRRAMAYYQSFNSGRGLSVEFIYQILGRGTRALAALRPGDRVDFLGSLGNTFDLNAARGREALLVAGGVGAAAGSRRAATTRRSICSPRSYGGGKFRRASSSGARAAATSAVSKISSICSPSRMSTAPPSMAVMASGGL